MKLIAIYRQDVDSYLGNSYFLAVAADVDAARTLLKAKQNCDDPELDELLKYGSYKFEVLEVFEG